ncbi:restriction endonuclease subunit S [Gramella sp. MT6]|uniref:restriction endonuclease subunit S n=1 Tax=Gramella sp. MT6 TaxID=2705471 RepID=UPI001C5DF2F5|nr:restriction endonuclease subunit S [Gramella sp. MT6]QYA25599.1 restriction endonuclease subunit S [Gramella sp. MT6]
MIESETDYNIVNAKEGYKNTKLGWIPENWSIKSLDELGEFSKGKGIAKKDILEEGIEGLPSVRYAEIYTHYHNYTTSFKSRINKDSAQNSNPIEKGDILFAGSGETLKEIGKSIAYLGDQTAYAGGDIIIFKQKNQDSQYLGYLLNTDVIRSQLFKIGQGHSVVHIYSSGLKKLFIPLPPLPEQQKIASIINTWDEAIKEQGKLIAQKQELKKGLMQQLLTGKKRFEGFDQEWKISKLGDIGNVKMCKRIFNSETNPVGGVPFYKIGTFGKEPDAYIEEELFEEYKKRFSYPKIGEILISASGTIGRTVVYNGEEAYYQDSNIIWIDNNENLVTNKFLFYVLNFVRFETEGGTLKRLYSYILKETEFLLPSLVEQEKIVGILEAVHQEIEKLDLKLKNLKKQKQGIIQQFLTGKKRLKL